MRHRSGRPGAVQISTLKPGDVFQYDTIDGVARYPEHMVSKTIDQRGNVEIKPFCDPAMTGWVSGDTWVFHKNAAGVSVVRGQPFCTEDTDDEPNNKGASNG
jgi:hypothetical protein